MSRILLSAYACEPGKGSEPEVGWMWATELTATGHAVWVITREANRDAIEARRGRAATRAPRVRRGPQARKGRRRRGEAVAAHDLHQLCRSGGPPAAALITSVDSRKYCGPIAAGVITQSAVTSWLLLLSNR